MDTRTVKWTPEFTKEWMRIYQRSYRKNHQDQERAKQLRYRIKYKDKIAEKRKLNNEQRRLYNIKWRAENRDHFNARQVDYRAKRKALGFKYKPKSARTKMLEKLRRKGTKYKAWQKEYQKRAIELIRKNRRNSNKRNRDTINAYRKRKCQTDPSFKISLACRSRMGTFMRSYGIKKDRKIMELLGVPSWDFLKQHLESQFKDGMTWKNHSFYGWHVEHIIPLAHFDLRDNTQLMKAFHYSNLQPLWATPNWIKGGRGKKLYEVKS